MYRELPGRFILEKKMGSKKIYIKKKEVEEEGGSNRIIELFEITFISLSNWI